MGYEIQFRCDGCQEVTPSFKMFRTQPPRNLGRWIYEHAHCANQWISSKNEEAGKFTRIIDSEIVGTGMQDWHFPVSNLACGWLENYEDIVLDNIKKALGE